MRRLSVMFYLTLLFVVPAAVSADENRGECPYFQVHSNEGGQQQFILESTWVKADVSGPIADVIVTQVYVNNGPSSVEAEYVFPASTRAAVHALDISIGERRIKAKLDEKQAARSTFNDARATGKTATLLEQHRPNVFQMSVTNIQPKDRIEVSLRYSEVLEAENGIYRMVYPTVVGPRYESHDASLRSSSSSTSWTANPLILGTVTQTPSFSFETAIHSVLPILNVRSPTHEVDITYEKTDSANVSLRKGKSANGDRDLIVEYQLAGSGIESGILTHTNDEEKIFLLTLEPPARLANSVLVPREYVFVVDVSGSMSGFPLETAKELMRSILSKLNPFDTFNVILFAGSQEYLFNTPQRADQNNIFRALAMIDQHSGGGGTEMYPALQRALATPRDEGHSRTIVLVTDGFVSVERELFSLVKKSLDQGNLFTFGIGTSVNRHLIEGFAALGGTDPTIVLNGSDAEAAAREFSESIAEPIMTDISLSFDGVEVYDVEPTKVHDLFRSEPITVIGKWRGASPGAVILKGRTGNGAYENRQVLSPLSSKGGEVLSTLWARERLKRLSDLAGIDQGNDSKVEITSLALKYNLLSEHTAFVGVDSETRGSSQPVAVRQPLQLPAETNAQGFYGGGSAGITKYSDQRVVNSVNAVMTYVEGTFGAIVMAVAGIGFILTFVMWCMKPRKSLFFMWIALALTSMGAFMLRSLLSTFFNDAGVGY